MPDIMGVILALSRVQSDLRMLQAQPERFPVDGHYDQIVTLTTTLEGAVRRWMAGSAADRRTPGDRREHQERRHAERPERPREVA